MSPRRPILTAAVLVVTGSLLAPPAADAAKLRPTRTARFTVVALKGQQTATWSLISRYSQACQGEIHESGSQTIAFKNTGKARLKIRLYVHGRNKFTLGSTDVHTGWIFTRDFSRFATPNTCSGTSAEAIASQSYDCGQQGPFPVPMNISYRGTLELSGVLNGVNGRGPSYKACDYEGYHETDILDAEGRLSRRKVFSRRKTIHVHVSARRQETLADGDGTQTTALTADATLRRLRK